MSLDISPAVALYRSGRPSGPPPRRRGGTVPRAHLLRRLTTCHETPVVLIVGPPGYGKTTLAAEWALRDERPFTWVGAGDDGGADAALRAVDDAPLCPVPH